MLFFKVFVYFCINIFTKHEGCLAIALFLVFFSAFVGQQHVFEGINIAVFYCLGKVSIVWANSVVLSIAERRCRID